MRGDVVYLSLPAPAGRRPGVVIQNDRDNARMGNTIVAQVTSKIQRAGEETQLLIDSSHRDWERSGLKMASVVNCSNIATLPNKNILYVIGSLSEETMELVDCCLKAALDLK